MLTAKDFREAIVNLIRVKAKLPYKVHFNHVNKSNESYIWVEITPQKRSWDKVYFQRLLNVDFHVLLRPDKNAEVKHTELWAISDALDAAIMPCFEIKDRFITVQEFGSHIFDDVLHYEFTLDFTDYVPSAEYEGLNYDLMQNLEVDLNRGTDQRIYFTESDEDETDEEEVPLPDPSSIIHDLTEMEETLNGGEIWTPASHHKLQDEVDDGDNSQWSWCRCHDSKRHKRH